MTLQYKNPRMVPVGNFGEQKKKVTATCFCGNEFDTILSDLKRGHTVSCGCICGEKHNGSNTRLYRIWKNMKNRCCNKNMFQYFNYGGRGIKVCDLWVNSFTSFCNWSIKNGYKETLTIDRVNNDGNYEPLNCRWVSRKEQSRNKNTNINYSGVCATDKSIFLGGKKGLVLGRMRQGWSKEKAFTTIWKNRKSPITHNGVSLQAFEWDKRQGFANGTVTRRRFIGWSDEKAIETPQIKRKSCLKY